MWLNKLDINPIPSLFAWEDPALHYFVCRDLLSKRVASIDSIWQTKTVSQLRRRQRPDGSWLYNGKTDNTETATNYTLLETFRNVRVLVEQYGFTMTQPECRKAAEYLFSCQTSEGDIRGILGSQYMPYYHGAILELLIKAGYGDDSRVTRGMEWLLTMQQNDGGWIVPAQAVPSKQKTNEFWLNDPILPDRTRPHSHMATGMVLRAFAAHPEYRLRPEVVIAGDALKSRLFKPDKYNDRKDSSYWHKLQFPFWWTSLLAALDTLYWLGFGNLDHDIVNGLEWFINNQESDGLWDTGYGSGSRAQANKHWVGLAVCRILRNYYRC